MNQIIISAIEHKTLLRFQYKGHQRLVEPHAYGVDADGQSKLRCYQIAGGSASFDPTNWKILNVSDIVMLQRTDQQFAGPRQGYKINDSAMTRIYAQLPSPNAALGWRR